MVYTTIIHPIRKRLGVTPFDYMLLDIIAKSQGNPNYSSDGWCTLSYSKIADWIGVSYKGLKKSSYKMRDLGLLEVNESSSKKRVTDVWFIAFTDFELSQKTGNKVPDNQDGEQSTPGNKVPHKGEQSTRPIGNKVPLNGELSTPLNIKDNSKYNSNIIFGQKNKKGGVDNLNEKEVEDLAKHDSGKKKKVAPKKKKGSSAAVLFSETEFYNDYDSFFSRFEFSEYSDADIRYYYEAVKNWADGKGEKRKDWIAVARQFMLRDRRDGKLVLNSNVQKLGQNGKYSNSENGQKGNPIIDVEQARRIAGL